MDIGTKAVVTGRDTYYLGKTQGNIFVDRIEIKGNPVQYVKGCLANKVPVMELYTRLSKLAHQEDQAYPFAPGKKMGRKAFWRNAYQYLAHRITKEKPSE